MKFNRIVGLALVMASLGGAGSALLNDTSATVYADDINLTSAKTPEEFINIIGPKAQEIAYANDLYASVMIAQAMLESGNGGSTLAKAPNYNLFGVKGAWDGQSVYMSTQENDPQGNVYTIKAGFRKYPDYTQSLVDNARVLRNGYFRGVTRSKTSSYKDVTKALQGTYATSVTYTQRLNELISQYNLTRFDKAAEAKDVTKGIKPKYTLKHEQILTTLKYKVQEGDTLWGIAQEYSTGVGQITDWNKKIKNKNLDDFKGEYIKVKETTKVDDIAYIKETVKVDIKKVMPKDSTMESFCKDNNLDLPLFIKLNNFDSKDQAKKNKKPREVIIGQKDEEKERALTPEEKVVYDKEYQARLSEAKVKEAKRVASLKVEAFPDLGAAAPAEVTDMPTEETENAPIMDSQEEQTITVIPGSDASENAKKLIDFASKQIGKPYVWGARGPSSFDCSGLMQYVYRNVMGMEIGAWTVPQESSGRQVNIADARPGDLYFWGSRGGTTHVALAIGGGQYIHAPQPGENVKIGRIEWFTPSFAVRVLP